MLFYIIGKNLRISLFLFSQELDISFCQPLQIPLKPFHLIEKVFDDMGCEMLDTGCWILYAERSGGRVLKDHILFNSDT